MVYIVKFGLEHSVALVDQWLEHQTTMGRSNGASSSLGCAFLFFFHFFIIPYINYLLFTVAILLKQQTMELLSCCLLSFAVEMDSLVETVYKNFSFANHQKILTLFDVVASSGNDFDLDDNAKFINAVNKRIKNILWNIRFFSTNGITIFLYGYLE